MKAHHLRSWPRLGIGVWRREALKGELGCLADEVGLGGVRRELGEARDDLLAMC